MLKYNTKLKKAMVVYILISMLIGNLALFSMQSQAPAPDQIMESNEVEGPGEGLKVYFNNYMAQCFYANGNYDITKVSLYVKDEVPNDDSLTIQIYDNDDMTTPFNLDDDVPGMQLPGASASANGPDNVFAWVNFSFLVSVPVTLGERYWIVASSGEGSDQGYRWKDSNGDVYPNGYLAEGGPSWIPNLDNDMMFRVYGETGNDVGIEEVITPKYQEMYHETNITAMIRNYGSNNQGSFDVRCVIRDPIGTEILNDIKTIISLDSGAVTNLTWFYIPMLEGTYTIDITTLLPGDEYSPNNAVSLETKVQMAGILKLHDEITIDGLSSDWYGSAPTTDDTWLMNRREYIWRDADRDDDGDGGYSYPSGGRFEKNPKSCLDLLEFRVAVDSNSINFLLIFESIDDGPPSDGTDGILGFSEQVIEILIDMDGDGTGRDDTIRNARLKIEKEIGWEYVLWADGWGNGYLMDEFGKIYSGMDVRGSPLSNAVEISIPALSGELIPDFEVWRYFVLVGAQDNNSLSYPIEGSRSGFMNVNATASETSGGGGVDGNGADSNVYDLAFASPQPDQLDDYGAVDIKFASYPDTTGAVTGGKIEDVEHWAQSFTPPVTSLLSSVDIYALDVGSDSANINITIQSNDDNGTSDPTDDEPSGINISSTEQVDFPVSYEWRSLPFSNPAVIREGETYWIVATSSGSANNGYLWGMKDGNPWPGGVSAQFLGGTWSQQAYDMLFNASYRVLTSVDANQAIYFAPIVINEVSTYGSAEEEWINIYYNGTINAPNLDMNDWTLTDQDGNVFQFNNFVLINKKAVTVHTGFGINTSAYLYWNRAIEVWYDLGEDVLLNSSFTVPVDFMNYTNGNVFGDAPPNGLNWGPEATENIPGNPTSLQSLSLKVYGRENDFYSDWRMKPLGRIDNKTLYLHDDGTYNPQDPHDYMDTIPPTAISVPDFDGDGPLGLTLKRAGDPFLEPLRYQEFNLTPLLARNFNIADDVIVDLWLDYDGGGDDCIIEVALYDCNDSIKTEIATESKTVLIDGAPGWQLVSITIPDLVYTLEKDHYLVLKVVATLQNEKKDMWMAYNTTAQPSRIRILPTQTFVNVDWIKTYDAAEVEKSEFIMDHEVVIKANISDPLGSYDILGANITITTPGGSVAVLDMPMTLIATDQNDPSAWKLFNFSFSGTSEPGSYTVTIMGIESNGVTHNLSTSFIVLESTPPQLTNPTLDPTTGSATTSFNFTITYTDFENHPPGVVVVNITGLGIFSMIALDPADLDYKDGNIYYINLTGFVNDTSYSYHFAANDSKGLWNETPEIFGPVIINTPPTLSNPTLTPIIGTVSTAFNYTVDYFDIDNQPPDVIAVNISGPSHAGSWAMVEVDPSDTDYTDGKKYYYNYTGLINGLYNYTIWANDTQGAWFETVEILGPQVVNTPPFLVNADVSPNIGYITTEFNYTVTYIDLDNQPQTEITVNISGPSHAGNWTMIEVDPSDTNYIDGKDFYYNFTGLIIGNYSFHCAAKDTQNAWTKTPELQRPDVLNSPPELTDYNLDPVTGFANITFFNYTVTYTDLDNQEPGSITLNITGPFTGDFPMNISDPSDTDYRDGKDYYYILTLPYNGTYGFRIEANDTGGIWAIPIIDIGPNVGGKAPLLSLPKVEPVIGITTTWFNFTVKYTHPEGKAAGVIILNLSGPSGGSFEMNETDPGDTNTLDGKFFYINLTGLQKGFYSFNVEGTDNTTFPAIPSKIVNAPAVLNSFPQLSGSYLNESNYGESWFNFTLVYKDIDNDSPGNVNVNILGVGNFTVINLDPADVDYTDGKEFYYNISIPKGTYQYRFEAIDSGFGMGWNYTIFDWIDLINNIPIFTEQEVMPSTGFGGDYFNFTVNVSDVDNDNLILMLYIDGEPGSPFVMQELDISDTNTINGKIYFYNLSLPKGTYNYNFSVFDGEGINQTIPLSLIVNNNPPVITTSSIVDTLEDSLYSVDYDHIDLDGDIVTWNWETNASWLNFDPATGLLDGTPTNLEVGSYYVNISVDDGDGGIDYHNFTLNVTNTPPLITTLPDEFAQEDSTYWVNFDCIDDDQGNIVYSLATNATWLEIIPDTGFMFVTRTPDNSDVGSFWVNVTVNDGNGGIDFKNYTLKVNNTPPTITAIPIDVVLEDLPHTDDIPCDDRNKGNTTYSLNTNASWLSIGIYNGILGGTPLNSHVGWYWVNITVNDGNGGFDSINYSLTVVNVNDAPTITTMDVITATEDVPYLVDYNATDIDPTMDNLTWVLITNASWLTINSTTGVLNGTPSNSDIGYYWVNVSVSDGNGGNDSTNFTLTVDDANDPPQIVTPNVEFADEDTQYYVDYDFIDVDDVIVTWGLVTNASWLIIDPITGNLSGTPENDDVGECWVNVTVTDIRGGVGSTNFTILVNNTPPSIINIPIEFTDEDEGYYEDFNCTDDNQGVVTYSLSTNATWLNINSSTGVLDGTPDNTDVGWFWVNVTVYDGNGGIDYVYYTITVNNSLPAITTIPETEVNEDSMYIQDFNCTDDGQGLIVYNLQTNALWLNIDEITGEVSGLPFNDDVGTYWVNVTVDDGNGGLDSINYSLEVINTNDAPTITTSNLVFIDEDSDYIVDYEYIDVDNDIVEWSLDTNATWLDIDPITGDLSGTPDNTHVGWFWVNVTLDDGNGGYDYSNFSLIVNNVNDPPSAPILLSPEDDSTVSSITPTFTWLASIDPDRGDHVSYYTLHYSTTSDFSGDVTTITAIVDTSYTPVEPLEDETIYYWRVEAFDTSGEGSGFQPRFRFRVDTGYIPPHYIGGLKSAAVKFGDTWTVDLDFYFQLGSITAGLTFTCNYDEVEIDPDTHIATWKPEKKDEYLEDVIFTVYDGRTNVSSHTIDLSIEKEVAPPTIWERIFWPWSLIPLVILVFLALAIWYKRLGEAPFVEKVFLIHEHSILITYASITEEEEIDKDILSGMLTGVKNLISDAFARKEAGEEEEVLKKLEFGDRNILLEKGNHFFIAVVFTGRENKDLLSRIETVIEEIETKYEDVLEDWDGDAKAFRGTDKIIETLLSTEELEEKTTEPPEKGRGYVSYGVERKGAHDTKMGTTRRSRGRAGLTNGLLTGIAVGRQGLTNGFTNGLTNGLNSIRVGITNGITNGNGIINGLGSRKRLMVSKRSSWRLITVPVVIFILIMIPFLAVDFSKPPARIGIDGDFKDWEDVVKTSDIGEALPFNLNVDIVDYSVDGRLSDLSFYVKVYGNMLEGEPEISGRHVDTAYIFIDTDQSQLSGYLINGMGADFMVKVEGWQGEIFSQVLSACDSNTLDWNLWEGAGRVSAAAVGSELEVQVPYSALYIGKKDRVDVLFYLQSYDKFEDFSDSVISNEKGVLLVNQQGVGEGSISGIGNTILRLDLIARDTDIEVTGIKLTRIGIGVDSDISAVKLIEGPSTIAQGTLISGVVELEPKPSISVKEGDSTTLYVEVDVGLGARRENSIGLRISKLHDITTNKGTIVLKNTLPSQNYYDISYIERIPIEVKIDGAFADWENEDIKSDRGAEVNNKNLEILEYSVSNTTDTVSFFLKVDGEIGWGTAVPYWNDASASLPPGPVEPGPPNPPGPSPPPPISSTNRGEDVIYIYIDSDNVSATGYSIGGIGADNLIEIKGKHGEITSKKHLSFTSSSPSDWEWIVVGSVDAATDTARLEAQVSKNNFDITGHFQVFFQTTDWSESESDYSDGALSRGSVDDYPMSSMVKIVSEDGTRGTGTVVGEVNQAPATIGWGDTTETEMLNFSIEVSGDNITINIINITHGGSGQVGDCTVYIYNESESATKGSIDGDEILLNTGGTQLTGAITQIDITNMDIGPGYKAYILITVVFNTDINDIGDDHYINVTAEKDLWLTDSADSINGATFPLTGGPTEIIPEFKLIAAPIIGTLAAFIVFRGKERRRKSKIRK